MSVFDYPRVNFWGTQRVNPATGNNNSLGPGGELTVTSDTDQVQPIGPTGSTPDAQFVKWMEGAERERPRAGAVELLRRHGMRFDDVLVTSVVLGPGKIVTEDPIIGAKVGLNNALVCDLNPEGFDCTQVFSSALQIQAPNAFGGTGQFLSRKPTRAASRSTNWYRNVSFHTDFRMDTSGGAGGASATFIQSFQVHKTDLKDNRGRATSMMRCCITGGQNMEPMADGPVTRRRGHARGVGRHGVIGLQVRFNLYLCYPRIPDSASDQGLCRRRENREPGHRLGARYHRAVAVP